MKTDLNDVNIMRGDGSLGRKLIKERSRLPQFEASQEVERYTRESNCLSLGDAMTRLEDDCTVLPERGFSDQYRIEGLMEEIDRKERDTERTLAELTKKNRELEHAKNRSEADANEWRKKFFEREGQLSKLVHKSVDGFRCKERDSEEKLIELMQKNMDLELEVHMWRSNYGKRERTEREANKKLELLEAENNTLKCEINVWKKKCEEMEAHIADDQQLVVHAVPLQHFEIGKFYSKETSVGVKAETVFSLPASSTEEVAAPGLRSYIKWNSKNQQGRTRSVQRIASSEQLQAVMRAEKLLSNLDSSNPSFVKSMFPSNVSTCFWLGLPAKFCKLNLPQNTLRMVLEDEQGLEHPVVYISDNTCLSGGWRGFALDHKLVVGDALIFELVEPSKFKVYIIRANQEDPRDHMNYKRARIQY